jgi:hypothetical protein
MTSLDKKDLITLVNAYADAKVSKNPHLINTMVSQLEQALDLLFPPDSEEPGSAPEEH